METQYFSQIEPEEPYNVSFKGPLIFFLVIFSFIAYDQFKPEIDNWYCQHLAAGLSEKYGLVVRYKDPVEFAIAPLPALVNDPEIGFFIEPADRHSASIALEGVRDALAKYPLELIHQYLKAVFIPGILKVCEVETGGTFFQSWIYVSATPDTDALGPSVYEETLHHELSSIFMAGNSFPEVEWCAANAPDFHYLPTQMEVIRAAASENQQDPANAPKWYAAGFVHHYGMSSLENDFNTYAELAMTEPEKLKQLAEQYPRIRKKTRILADFYSRLAPELQKYFEQEGLRDKVVHTNPLINKG